MESPQESPKEVEPVLREQEPAEKRENKVDPKRRWGAYAHAMTGIDEGSLLFRGIGDSMRRIRQRWETNGTTESSPRHSTIQYLADSRFSAVMNDENIEDPNTLAWLKDIHHKILEVENAQK